MVDSYQLASALGHSMAVLARRHRLALTCTSDAQGLAQIHEPVTGRVLAVLECTTESANSAADIRLENGVESFQSSPGELKPLVEEVEAGVWTITVTFPDGTLPPAGPASYQLTPPVFDELEVP